MTEARSSQSTYPAGRPIIDTSALENFLLAMGTMAPDLIYGPKSGAPLYHYTDLNGLHGIVQNQDLWITHARYSNDEQEMQLGYDLAKKVIEAVRVENKASGKKLKYLKAVAELIDNPVPTGVYICCFCEEDNLLSQWRSYGANGTGVSVKFDPQRFSYIAGPDSPPAGLLRLWAVNYEPQRQEKILRQALEYAYMYPDHPSSTPQERARQAADFIEFFIPTFKHNDFKEEKEYRLIFTPSPISLVKPQFRVGRGMLIPYYSLKALLSQYTGYSFSLPIMGVRVGPSANKRLNLESAQMLLEHAGYTFKVESSETPYRG